MDWHARPRDRDHDVAKIALDQGVAPFRCLEDKCYFRRYGTETRSQFLPTLVQRTRNYVVGSESRWQFTVRGNSDSKATKLLLTEKSIESVELSLCGVSQCAGMQGHVWATKVLGLKFPPRTLEHRLDSPR